MATAPAYSSTTPRVLAAAVSATADTVYTAPVTAVTTLGTGGTSGTQIYEIWAQGIGSTLAGNVNIFLYDGSTYHMVDQFTVPAVTASTTATAWRQVNRYTNLLIPSNTWSLRMTSMVASQLVKVSAFGGDY